MDKKLARLFDYQKYSPNSDLEKIISDVDSRHSIESSRMSDEELGMLNAAGNVDVMRLKKKDK